ncbi:MAG TPA: hypothetical protein PLG55_11915 [Methanospirillum sp.]|jgi:hypothetical protein|nr:hypothetical protein [Methanospirillum sp.]
MKSIHKERLGAALRKDLAMTPLMGFAQYRPSRPAFCRVQESLPGELIPAKFMEWEEMYTVPMFESRKDPDRLRLHF